MLNLISNQGNTNWNTPTVWPATPLLGIYPTEVQAYVYQDIYKNVHCGIIWNSPKLEATQKPIHNRNCGILIQWNTLQQLWWKKPWKHKTWANLTNIILRTEIEHKRIISSCMLIICTFLFSEVHFNNFLKKFSNALIILILRNYLFTLSVIIT